MSFVKEAERELDLLADVKKGKKKKLEMWKRCLLAPFYVQKERSSLLVSVYYPGFYSRLQYIASPLGTYMSGMHPSPRYPMHSGFMQAFYHPSKESITIIVYVCLSQTALLLILFPFGQNIQCGV